MASIQAHTVLQHLLPLGVTFVTGVVEPTVRLKEDGRAKVFLAVPPIGWA